MKAVWMTGFGGPDVLRVVDTPVPVPGPGQVLIEVEAAGVTYGDVMKRQGGFGNDFELPAGLGQEVAGTVRQTCAGGPAMGSRVAAMVDHGYAEYAVARSDAVVTLPDAVDYRSAAALWVHGLTAYQTICDAGHLSSGETILVHAAAGGVGTLATQLGTLLGAGRVIGTAGTPDKLDHVRAHGADLAVDYSDPGWAKAVLDATHGHGVDLVLDSVGGHISEQTLECTAPFGRIVSFGAASGTVASYTGMSLMTNNLTVTGYSLLGWLKRSDRIGQALQRLLGFVARNELQLTITDHSLGDVVAAHQALGERHTVGKVILRP
ncbi:zinc-binding dehydrogenase [Mycolicibacterium hippocampi]|uniref:Alcohol dehydrogenase n=1 Tax=Mycolicibacterium hippocampi TaxID=659824 RepID=A0A850PPK4_9MYCO|nr:zinc-binding dehydrogenase [Mycolicibacterium hippocampi]NVN49345.1 alcohol dehydrogenase [Mycolicibacterium hippocampi]